ncbi:uncharacterized protein TM35_000054700 [Trypanosoma theileri]|uniref:Uncharacterized protein n=1 Tax=Trypanosoma theileri TaxID=67003 RepID=A0A1X0P4K7_9TRYP|nr:uncharacterized protein TM35_000054700 [Trypanosoma theileri]ORC91874.1 hypothetical protein TM35_000054700 [Trypanosoma theileri]
MIFQASRFSASGRKVPLEPRRSEACQPMHVLSFGEGGKLVVFVFVCCCGVRVWNACRAATALRQEFRPTPLRLGRGPFQDEPLGASVYIALRRREPSRLGNALPPNARVEH